MPTRTFSPTLTYFFGRLSRELEKIIEAALFGWLKFDSGVESQNATSCSERVLGILRVLSLQRIATRPALLPNAPLYVDLATRTAQTFWKCHQKH